MGEEAYSARRRYGIDKLLRVWCKPGQFGARAEHEQVISLGLQLGVVDFLPGQQQHPPTARTGVITFRPLHPHVVVSDNQEIEPGAQRGFRQVIMIEHAIGMGRVVVHVPGILVQFHRRRARSGAAGTRIITCNRDPLARSLAIIGTALNRERVR